MFSKPCAVFEFILHSSLARTIISRCYTRALCIVCAADHARDANILPLSCYAGGKQKKKCHILHYIVRRFYTFDRYIVNNMIVRSHIVREPFSFWLATHVYENHKRIMNSLISLINAARRLHKPPNYLLLSLLYVCRAKIGYILVRRPDEREKGGLPRRNASISFQMK